MFNVDIVIKYGLLHEFKGNLLLINQSNVNEFKLSYLCHWSDYLND